MEIAAGVYRHYKGPHYLVLGLAHDADGGEDRVVYVPMYEVSGAPLAVRTLSGFTSGRDHAARRHRAPLRLRRGAARLASRTCAASPTDPTSSDNDPRVVARRVKEVPAEVGLVVEDAAGGFCGAVLGLEKGPGGEVVCSRTGIGPVRRFPLMVAGFLLDGATVTLVKPPPAGGPRRAGAQRRPAPSRCTGHRARVAREGRIYVEGSARRRAGGEGLGPRPAGRGRGGRAAARHRRPARDRRASSRPVPAAGSGCWSTTWCRAPRRAASSPAISGAARAGHRPPLRRRLGGGQARAALGIAGLAAASRRGTDWKTGVCAELGWPVGDGARVAAGARAGCAPGRTWRRRCSARSSS